MRGDTRALEPRGATVELDPQRGETGRHVRLPQSFLLCEVVRTPSMVPTPPIKLTMGPTTLTSRVMDMDVSLSVVSRMVTLVLGFTSFSTSDLMVSRVDLACVFRLVATLFEGGSVVTSGGVCEGVDVGQPVAGDVAMEQLVISGVDSLWQAVVVAKMDTLPIRPTIDRERLTPSLCMLDNRSGIFRLVSPMGQVYRPDRVLLDSGAQPFMLGKTTCIGLGIRRLEFEPCPFQIQTSLGGASDRSHFMTCERLLVQMKSDHAIDSSRLGVIVIVTTTKSYDVLVGGVVLYRMGFQMDYWIE